VRPGAGNYRLFRIEGYVFARPYANTAPLYSLWSAAKGDNRATADPGLWGRVPASVSTPQGAYRRYRLEGHLLKTARGEEPPADEDALVRRVGLGRLTPPVARVPVLILLHEWRDQFFAAGASDRYRSAFTPAPPVTAIGLEQYSGFLSGGRFRFPVADVVGPFRDSVTLAEASRFTTTALRQRAIRLLIRNGVDLSRFDTNRDGWVRSNELIIARFVPGGGSGGQQGFATAAIGGISVNTSVVLLAEDSGLSGVVHELLHTYRTEDVYGPNFSLNYMATLMAAHLPARDYATQQLDPYHRMQLGWLKPVMHSLAGDSAAQVFALSSSDARPSFAGVILFDPARPREYFVLQARDSVHPADRVAARIAPGRGVMVWHVLTDADNSLRTIGRRQDTRNRISWPRGADKTQQVQGALALGADGLLGRPVFFTPSSPAMELRWFDGTLTGAQIKVLASTAGSVDVALQRRGALSLPRIDSATPLARGGTATFTGIMPLADRDAWSIKLRRFAAGGGGLPTMEQVALPVEGWALYGVTVRVPAAAAAGTWELIMEGPSAGLSSNSLSVSVR
jgi:hypothetical protein